MLIQWNLLGYCFPAHMTYFKCIGALGTGSMSAQEYNVLFSFHANTACVAFLNFGNFAFQISENICTSYARFRNDMQTCK